MLVHNDFHQAHGLFPLFDDLEVEDLDKPVEVWETNGTGETNGVDAKPNGFENTPLTNGSVVH
jgi:methylenetetrahydrofolate reductase (NADPH)